MKTLQNVALLVLSLGVTHAPASAPVVPHPVYFTGEDLQNWCSELDEDTVSLNRGMCIGFIAGVYDGTADITTDCRPDPITYKQMILLTRKYLSAHPEKLNIDAADLVLDASKEAFPCSTSPTD